MYGDKDDKKKKRKFKVKKGMKLPAPPKKLSDEQLKKLKQKENRYKKLGILEAHRKGTYKRG